MSTVILGDTHHPFADADAIKKALGIIEKLQPKRVIQQGDLYDMLSFGRFPRNPNIITPADEIDLGRAHAEDMWKEVKKAAPKAERIQLKGNHDLRAVKLAMDKADALTSIVKKFVDDMMKFPGVTNAEDEEEIDGVTYMHGFRKPGAHAVWNQQSTVVGHSHVPGCYSFRNRKGPYWELNVGWLGDPDSPVFDYRSQKKIDKMSHAIGIIDELGPRWVPL